MPLADRKRIEALERRLDRIEQVGRQDQHTVMRELAEIDTRLTTTERDVGDLKTREPTDPREPVPTEGGSR